MVPQRLSYRASLKNPDVEEPIDLLVHRPLGYLIARACVPTRVSPDVLTVLSLLVGVVAGALVFVDRGTASGMWTAGALFVLSAVLDCSDGQLARMRGGGSKWGRMLDGAVDAVVQIAVLPFSVLHLVIRHGGFASGEAIAWGLAAVLAILVGIRHTTMYDQFKNIYVRNTEKEPKDCDDADDVENEYQRVRAAGELTAGRAFRLWFYLAHMKLVASTMRWIDPNIPSRFKDMPHYSPERAEHFRSLNRALMRWWSMFGIGTHIFLFAACLAINSIETYVVLRLGAFNLLLAVLVPVQRRASRAFFHEPPIEPIQAAA